VLGAWVYPVFGHWVWGNGYLADNKPWLASLGFVDFAGSSVVHIVGGVASLVGVWFVGPRMGRFTSDGKRLPMPPYNLVWSAAGTLVLWLGWWGFNGGSTLALNGDVGSVIFNTNLAGAAAGTVAFAHSRLFQNGGSSAEKMMGGALAGLVAITANCHIVSATSAIAIGAIAGLLHNVAFDFLQNRLDDVVGAVPVHAVGGVWGIIAVALFGRAEVLPNAFLPQLGIQALGAAVCVLWTGANAFLAFSVLKAMVGIRVSPAQELHGVSFEDAGIKSVDPVAMPQPAERVA
jgi:Amt family ammonium transporter